MLATIGWLLLAGLLKADEVTELRMPGILPTRHDSYICTSIPLDLTTEHYITEFKPRASMKIAHHMLLFGCDEPGSEDLVWDCGEMTSAGPGVEKAPTCKNKPKILYAWGRDAPTLELPEGVGFKVGGETAVRSLVLQVHYAKKVDIPDYSGVGIVSTEQPLEKTADVLLLVTGGTLPPLKKESFETACVIDEDVEMHPFAFRTHAHARGKDVSGWRVREDAKGVDHWDLIGNRDPLAPQMFQPANNSNLVIRQGDMVAARCVMDNKENHEIQMGATGDDEMCNYYMMYWVWGDHTLSDNTCYSPGAPDYHWATEGGLNNVPKWPKI